MGIYKRERKIPPLSPFCVIEKEKTFTFVFVIEQVLDNSFAVLGLSTHLPFSLSFLDDPTAAAEQ